MSFEQNLAEKAAHCEKVLRDMLPSVEGLQGTDRYAAVVVDAMQYSVMAGGKRLRDMGVNYHALAIIDRADENGIVFRGEE